MGNKTRATSSTTASLSFPGGFVLDVSTSSANTVTVNRASFSAHTDPSGKHNLGAYFSINQGTTQSVTATLKFTYSAGMSSSVASSLRFAYWDSGTSAWVFPSTGGSVDTSTRVVSQTTTHFSEWAVFANNATATGTLGSGVSVAANTETTINYGGFDLFVHTTTASTVTLSSYASVVTTMPSGYSALGFSAQAGFTLAIDGGGAPIKAELTTPPLTTSAAALITGSVSAGCLQYDVDARAYNKIDIDTYTAGTKTIKVQLPKAGTYLFAAVSANAQIPTFYNKARATASTSVSLSFPGGFVLDVSTSSSNTVTVSRASYSSRSDPSGKHNLGAYFDISQGTTQSVTATLKFTYSAGMSSSVASSLRFAYWDSGTSAWVFPRSGGSVDTSARVVS